MATTALSLAGLLRRSGQPPATIEQMNEAVEQMAVELNPRVQP